MERKGVRRGEEVWRDLLDELLYDVRLLFLLKTFLLDCLRYFISGLKIDEVDLVKGRRAES